MEWISGKELDDSTLERILGSRKIRKKYDIIPLIFIFVEFLVAFIFEPKLFHLIMFLFVALMFLLIKIFFKLVDYKYIKCLKNRDFVYKYSTVFETYCYRRGKYAIKTISDEHFYVYSRNIRERDKVICIKYNENRAEAFIL